MSELIYPDEALPEINTENSLASELIFNGVGIYFSDDNLVTVINIVDGSAGVATDITNNILGEVSGNYSVGADISSLTAGQQLQVNDNPYQLFKTNETVEQEYELIGDKASSQKVTFDLITPSGTNTTSSYSYEFRVFFDGGVDTDVRTILGTNRCIYRASDGLFLWNGASSEIRSNLSVSLSDYVTFKVVKAAGASDHDVYINDQFVSTVTMGSMHIVDTLMWNNVDGYSNIRYDFFRFIDNVTPTNSRFWDFNQTRGDYVEDHYNGAIATLVGFPADSGYLRDDGTGQLTGYQFGTATASLPLVGAYTGLITYTDDTTLAISGSGAYLVNAGIIASITVTDTTGDLSFDCTTGDQGKIVETLQGKNAVISNDSVVKWQPISSKSIYTVGEAVNWDYATIRLAAAAQNADLVALGTSLEFKLYGEHTSAFPDWRGYGTDKHNTITVVGGEEGAGYITTSYKMVNDNLAYIKYSDFTINFTNGLNTNVYGTKDNTLLERVTLNGSPSWKSFAQGKLKDCLITNMVLGVDSESYNCIVVLQSGSWYDANNWDIFLHNTTADTTKYTVGYKEFSGGSYGGTFNVTTTDNLIMNGTDTIDGTTNADMTGWFDANYQITEAGRTAIGTDTGWNGSTICGWADAAGTPVTVTELTYSDSTLGLLADTIALQRTTSVNFTDSTLGMSADEMTLDELIELIFSDSTLGMTADEMSLTELINLVYSDATFGLTSNEIVLQKIVNLLFTDSTFGMTADEISLARTTNVEFSDSTLAMVADEISLQRITNLLFNDSTLGMTADQIELSANIILEYLDSTFGMTADEISIQRSTALVFDNSTFGMTADEISLARTTNVSYFDSSFNLNADEMTLITGSMPNLGLNDVKLINASISYKLQDNNLAYSLQDNNPIYKLN